MDAQYILKVLALLFKKKQHYIFFCLHSTVVFDNNDNSTEVKLISIKDKLYHSTERCNQRLTVHSIQHFL